MAAWMHTSLVTWLVEGETETDDDLAVLSATVGASTLIALAGATLYLLSS